MFDVAGSGVARHVVFRVRVVEREGEYAPSYGNFGDFRDGLYACSGDLQNIPHRDGFEQFRSVRRVQFDAVRAPPRKIPWHPAASCR